MSGLTQRVVTAFFFVAVMVGGIYGGRITFAILFTLITLMCLWEFLNLTLPKNTTRKIIGVIIGLFPFAVVALLKLDVLKNPAQHILHSSLLILPMIFLTFIYELFTKSEKPFSNLGMMVLGVVYLGLPIASLNFIAYESGIYNPNIIMGLLLLTWTNDTFAYFTGSKLGKTKLLERISPKKTWEGTIGGAIGTIGLALILSYVFPEVPLIKWAGLGIIAVIFGGIGDLIESMLKRSLGVKDTGTILPGHGGFLDRFDAFIFMLPFATAYLLWF